MYFCILCVFVCDRFFFDAFSWIGKKPAAGGRHLFVYAEFFIENPQYPQFIIFIIALVLYKTLLIRRFFKWARK